MEHACATITICFEEPFWIALYERIEAGHCTVCKITFGAEPKDYEVAAMSMWSFTLQMVSSRVRPATFSV